MHKISKDEAMALLRKVRDGLRSEGVPVQKILLFGSVAVGKQHAWSDIDVAIVHKPFLESKGKEKARLFERGKSFDVRLEILSFRPEDLANRYSAIAKEVQTKGIPVE